MRGGMGDVLEKKETSREHTWGAEGVGDRTESCGTRFRDVTLTLARFCGCHDHNEVRTSTLDAEEPATRHAFLCVVETRVCVVSAVPVHKSTRPVIRVKTSDRNPRERSRSRKFVGKESRV